MTENLLLFELSTNNILSTKLLISTSLQAQATFFKCHGIFTFCLFLMQTCSYVLTWMKHVWSLQI